MALETNPATTACGSVLKHLQIDPIQELPKKIEGMEKQQQEMMRMINPAGISTSARKI